jgi:hypothetical protein
MVWRNQPYRHPVASVVIIAVALFLVTTLVRSATPEIDHPDPCMSDEARERVRELVLQGIEVGLQDHIKHVFTLWIKDDTEQPKRAITGMHAGIRAYTWARAAALKWNPPRCEEKKP